MYLFLYETVFLQLFRSLSLSQDLTFVQIGNPDLIDGKINFAKRWQQFNILVSSGVRTAEFSSQKFFRCCKQSSQNGFQLQIVKLKTRPTLTQHIYMLNAFKLVSDQDNLRRFKKEQYQLTRNEDIIGFFSEFDKYITEDEMWALRSLFKPIDTVKLCST